LHCVIFVHISVANKVLSLSGVSRPRQRTNITGDDTPGIWYKSNT